MAHPDPGADSNAHLGRSRNKRREEPEAEAADLPPETWRDGKFDFNDYLIESIQVGTIEEIDDENEDEDRRWGRAMASVEATAGGFPLG